MSQDAANPLRTTFIASAASVVGLLVGAITIYSRMESEMEEEITRRVKVETRLSSVETQAKANKDAIWTIQMRQQSTGGE